MNKLQNLLFERVHIQRIYVNAKLKERITEQFHRLYYDSHSFGQTWYNTFWLGVKTFKLPLDLWVYQEILYALKPDTIIETGTSYGGSALFLASICDLLNNGRIITIDTEQRKDAPRHKRIKYLLGSSISNDIVKNVRNMIKRNDKVVVILDSDHHKNHVLKEMEIYSKFVTKGSYLIVEDTNINGHPVYPDFGPGPMEAVREFLYTNKNFAMDRTKEKFYLTFNPKGYLLRK